MIIKSILLLKLDTGTSEVDLNKLREEEHLKIKCGKAHFKEFANLEYLVVKNVGELTI